MPHKEGRQEKAQIQTTNIMVTQWKIYCGLAPIALNIIVSGFVLKNLYKSHPQTFLKFCHLHLKCGTKHAVEEVNLTAAIRQTLHPLKTQDITDIPYR